MNTFTANFLLELRSILRRPTIYVATTLLFTYWSIFSARLKLGPDFWGPNGGVYANAPVVLYYVLATQAFVAFLFVPIVVGPGPLRERSARLTETWLSTPVRPVTALWGRFSAAFILLALSILVASSGILLSPYLRLAMGKMPGIELGPVPWMHLLQAWSIITLPTLFFASTLIFWMVAITRRISAAIAGTIVLILGAVISHYFGKTMHYAALEVIDPTCFHAIHRSLSYWTIPERNHDFLELNTTLLANRSIWLTVGIGLSLLGSLTFNRSRFAFGHSRRFKRDLQHDQDRSGSIPRHSNRIFNIKTPDTKISQFFARLTLELQRIIQEPLFNVVLATLFLWLVGQNVGILELEFIKAPARAELLVSARRGLWMLVFYFVPYLAASTTFFERDLPGSEYLDALPIPNWMQWMPKLCALVIYCAVFPTLVLLAGIVTQLFYGETSINWFVYLEILTSSYYPYVLQIVFVSFGISMLSSTRAVAYALTMLVLYASIFGYETANLDSELGRQMYETSFSWSPFDGLGAYTPKIITKSAFWICISLSCLTLTTAFWKRGQRSRRPQSGAPARFAIVLFLGGLGLFLARFTHQEAIAWKQSRLRPTDDSLRARYEQTLSQYRKHKTPDFGAVDMKLDLFPDQASYMYTWNSLVHQLDLESDPLIFLQTPVFDSARVHLGDMELQPIVQHPELGASIYEIDHKKTKSLHSVLSIQSEHRFLGHPEKRKLPLGVLQNGTYLNKDAFPEFEYASEIELDTNLERASYELAPKKALAHENAFTRRDCPWSRKPLPWEFTISTTDDQYAVAPGTLTRTWHADGRRYFTYSSEHPDCSEPAFASAKYKKTSTSWILPNKQRISGRVLFLRGYEDQAAQINTAATRVLRWLSGILGPYPYTSLQIVQVRDDAVLGTSPANTVFLRESEAWALRREAPQDEHQRIYFLIVRLAQHWLHNKLAPADVGGKGLFTEGIPAFLAHKYLEELFGTQWVERKYILRAMRRYVWYHSAHTSTELPVIHSPVSEHIHAYKSALALRVYSKAMSMPRMKALLRELVSQTESAPITASQFLDRLNDAIPGDRENTLGEEMMTDTIHYDNQLHAARVEPIETGQFRLTLELQAMRFHSDPDSPNPYPVDWTRPLPILVHFEKGAHQPQDHLERVPVQNGSQRVELKLEAMPVRVTIDPHMELLDVSLRDQSVAVQGVL